MFKFGFSSEKDEEPDQNDENKIAWEPSQEVNLNNEISNKILRETSECNIFACGKNMEIKYLDSVDVIATLDENSINSVLQAEQNHSDLIPGVYEGGLKMWECTFDLANYICDENLELKDKKVLDLGCGMGLIGILALLKGSYVDFQDYNSDVLEYITTSNVLLNQDETEINEKCKFYSGDWKSFVDLIHNSRENIKYDYIFTSETIYNTTNYDKLIKTFKELLKDDGKIFLAAKTYYFGVGGGLRQFEDCLRKKNFSFSTVWNCSDGINREILQISFK